MKSCEEVDIECWLRGLSVLLWEFDMFFILSDLLGRICRSSFAEFEFHGSLEKQEWDENLSLIDQGGDRWLREFELKLKNVSHDN